MTFSALEGQLSQLVARRDALKIQTEATLEAAQRAGRSTVLPAEARALDNLRAINERIADVAADLERAGGANLDSLHARIETRNNPTPSGQAMSKTSDFHLQYRKGDNSVSWLRDMTAVQRGTDDTGEARSRLMRHAQEVQTDAAYLEFRDLTRVDGAGGYAVPPAWLMNQYVELARPGRAFANVVQRQPLPGGTDSINIPKILSGTVVGIQQTDNQDLSTAGLDVDITDTFISSPVRTIAGQQGIAIQLIDQSPIAFDDVIFRDLVAAHAAALDQQVLDGTGTSGQVTGVDYTAGIQTVSVSAMTATGVYAAIANAVQLIHTKRFLPPEVILMHPRRWGWLLSQVDLQGRPLFLPVANGAFNAAGLETAVASQQVVGMVQGLPVVTDPNITTTAGPGGTGVGTDDQIYVTRASDLILWETGVRGRVLPESKATTLTVLLQIYSYVAFTAARYPQSTVVIQGLTAPTF
jgi:HK97 family phage major capsid protein